MNTILENYDINHVEILDDNSSKWSITWTNHHGGMVSENGKNHEELIGALNHLTDANGFNIRLMVGPRFVFPDGTTPTTTDD